jgi:hypothetical protein
MGTEWRSFYVSFRSFIGLILILFKQYSKNQLFKYFFLLACLSDDLFEQYRGAVVDSGLIFSRGSFACMQFLHKLKREADCCQK